MQFYIRRSGAEITLGAEMFGLGDFWLETRVTFEVKITADDPMAVNCCWLQNSGPLLLLCSVIFAEIKCTGQVALSKRPINYISRNTYCLVTCLNL